MEVKAVLLRDPNESTPVGEAEPYNLLLQTLPQQVNQIAVTYFYQKKLGRSAPCSALLTIPSWEAPHLSAELDRVLVSCLLSSADITGWENWNPAA